MDKVSKTPRTDAHCKQIIDDALGLEYAATELQYWAEKLEEELAEQKEHYRVLTDEMLVMMDERNAAVAALHVNAGENSRPQD